MESRVKGMLRIGALRVDPQLDEIERDGRIHKLEPKAMRLLLCLAEHSGEVLSVEQLLAEVWPDVIVTPLSLYQLVTSLRRALGDDPKRPTYIANVVRRGYRLVAPVSPWVAAPGLRPEAAAPGLPPALVLPDSVVAPGAPRGSVPAAAPEPTAGAAPSLGPVPAPVTVPKPMLGLESAATSTPGSASTFTAARRPWLRRWRFAAIAAVILLLGIGTWQVRWSNRARTIESARVVVQDRSVAVLPFRDLSEHQDQEYFADGLVEEIIDLLANVPGLRVPARTSSFYFKGKATNVQEIARVLGVAHVLEGSIRRAGDGLRIATTLSRAADGYQIWSQTYDLGGGDITSIQRDIAAAVVRNLTDVILPDKPGSASPPVPAEAYRTMLRARFLLDRGSDKDNREAIASLRGALELAPTYAAAWGELARAYRHRASYFDETPDENIAAARTAAGRALALDPDCVEAHEVLAAIARIYDFDPAAGVREVAAIRAVVPNRPVPDADLFYISSACVMAACYEQVIRDTDEQIAIDPLNPIPYWTQSLARYVFGDLDGAERRIRHAIELSPNNGYQHYLLARIAFARRDRTLLLEMTQPAPDSRYTLAARVLAFHALGRSREAGAALQDLITHGSQDAAYQIAEVYAAMGQQSDAMTWLEKAYVQHDPGLWALRVDPLLRPLAGSDRFSVLQTKLHMQ